MKKCTTCEEEMEATTEFFSVHHVRGDGTKALSGRCRACQRVYSKAWRHANPERYKAQMIRFRERNPNYEKDRARARYRDDPRVKERINLYNKNNPDKRRLQGLRAKYKLDPTILMNKMDSQRGCCALCGKSLVVPGSTKSYHVDHNHDTGEVRGLLCARCNNFIGVIDNNPGILFKVISYLDNNGVL